MNNLFYDIESDKEKVIAGTLQSSAITEPRTVDGQETLARAALRLATFKNSSSAPLYTIRTWFAYFVTTFNFDSLTIKLNNSAACWTAEDEFFYTLLEDILCIFAASENLSDQEELFVQIRQAIDIRQPVIEKKISSSGISAAVDLYLTGAMICGAMICAAAEAAGISAGCAVKGNKNNPQTEYSELYVSAKLRLLEEFGTGFSLLAADPSTVCRKIAADACSRLGC